MKKTLTGAVAAVALAAAAFTTPATAAEKVIVGTEAAYAPFEYVNPQGEIVGFEIDLGNAICEAAELDCQWVNVPFDALIAQLMERKIDAIMSSMSMTEKRKQTIDFTKKYFQVPNAFVAEKGKDFELTEEGLDGMVIGVQSGTTNADYLKEHFEDAVEIRRYPTQEEVTMDLVNGRLDAMVVDSVIASEWFKTEEGADYHFVGPMLKDPVFGQGVGVGLRKGSDELKQKFEAGIDKVMAEGIPQELSQKWFGVNIYE